MKSETKVKATRIETIPMQLTTLSPVFIGCGIKVSQAHYFSEGNQLFLCDEGALAMFLWQHNQTAFNQYQQMLPRIVRQKQFNEMRDNQDGLGTLLAQHPGIKAQLMAEPNMLRRFSIAPGHYPNGVTGDVQLFHHNGNGFYIPGSSIKGAIRQLLLTDLVAENFRFQEFDKYLNKDDMRKINAKRVEAHFLRKQWETNDITGPLADFMRVLRVSDSAVVPDDCFEVVRTTSVYLPPNTDIKRKTSPRIQQLVLKPDSKITFFMTIDHSLITQFKARQKNVPFDTVQSLLQRLQNGCAEMGGLISEQIEKANKDSVFNGLSGEPNFYLGANTGFDRHSLLSAFGSENPDARLLKKAVLEAQFRKVKRGKDIYVPRCLRVSKISPRDASTFGWCRLEIASPLCLPA